ncbi:MAG: CAP domain-containing protein [Actinomycetota bacterium]|nr:CAP domain-containing protein [Actinomycetota bacterium]
MKFVVKRMSAAIVLALAVGALSPVTTASAGGDCWRYKDSEREFAQKINAARDAVGANRLEIDRELSKVARRHAWEMDSKNSLYHTPSDKLRWRVTRWNRLGENVGAGQTVLSLHRAFMNSPSHRSNVLDRDFRHLGVGVHRDQNYIWVTMVFESRRDPGTRLRMCR